MPIQGFGLNKRRRDVFAQLITQLTGVPVTWKSEPDAQVDPIAKQKITLRWRGTRTASEWDKITVDTSTGTNTQLGAQRIADIEMLIESWDPDVQAPETFYMFTTRVYRDRFRAILHEANMAMAGNSDALDLPTKYDEHLISACVGTLNVAFAELDPFTDDLDTFIETVDGDNIIPGNYT